MNMKFVNRNLVLHDGHRWFDAFGPNVAKVIEEFVYTGLSHVAAGGTSAIVGGWTVTAVEGGANETTAVQIADGPGGILQIATDAGENDGANLQVVGESFTFTSAYPTYFGVRFKLNTDATQCDFLAGLCITDTDLLGGMSEGVYFRKVDGATTLNFVLEEATVETATAFGTAIAPDVWYIAEFFYNGAAMDWWINGVLQTRPVTTNLPNAAAVNLTPSIHYLTGEGNANVCEIDWIRAIQIQV